MTAAHCALQFNYAVFNRVTLDGLTDRGPDVGGGFFELRLVEDDARRVGVDNIFPHDLYDGRTGSWDVMLVHVDEFDALAVPPGTIKPATLVETMAIGNWEVRPFDSNLTHWIASDPGRGQPLLRVQGWGDASEEEGIHGSQQLREGHQVRLDPAVINAMLAEADLIPTPYEHDSMFATETLDGVPCKGDSGGPVIASRSDGKAFLVGVHVRSLKPCRADRPSVHTRLTDAELEWIYEKVTGLTYDQ